MLSKADSDDPSKKRKKAALAFGDDERPKRLFDPDDLYGTKKLYGQQTPKGAIDPFSYTFQMPDDFISKYYRGIQLDLIETLHVPITDTATSYAVIDGMMYKVTRSPKDVDVFLFEMKKGEKKKNLSKIHLQRDLDGRIQWLEVGAQDDRQEDIKIYSKVDFFMKKLEEPKATITKIDEEIANALEMKADYPWTPAVKPPYNTPIRVIKHDGAQFSMPGPKDSVNDFLPLTVLEIGKKLADEGNKNFSFYPKRYEMLNTMLERICSRECNCAGECPITRPMKKIKLVKRKVNPIDEFKVRDFEESLDYPKELYRKGSRFY